VELGDVSATPVLWQVTLDVAPPVNNAAQSNQPVRFHAWLERDDDGPSGLSRAGQPPLPVQDSDRACTVGTLSCGPDAIVVGGYSTALGSLGPWGLSGHGPSRRGTRLTPDLAAPAHYLALVRSGRGNGAADSLARVTGTSVAAPFVTGTIACIYEKRPGATLAEVRAALVQTAQALPGEVPGWSSDLGHGQLDPARVLARFP
jgi:subtilisin family serine protease